MKAWGIKWQDLRHKARRMRYELCRAHGRAHGPATITTVLDRKYIESPPWVSYEWKRETTQGKGWGGVRGNKCGGN